MKERILNLELDDAIGFFAGTKYKFFQENLKGLTVKIEVPRGSTEQFVVELHFQDHKEMGEVVMRLETEGFIQEEIRVTSEW
jgi:hypothetical protein